MATLTFQGVSTGTGTLTKTYTVSEADFTRFINAMQTAYNKAAAGQAMLAWADDVVSRAKDTVRSIETTPPAPPTFT